MLTEYIQKARSKAVYEKLEGGTYSGEIPECPGTIALDRLLAETPQRLLPSILRLTMARYGGMI